MHPRQTVIYSTEHLPHAQLLGEFLDEQEIDFALVIDTLVPHDDSRPARSIRVARVLVSTDDVARVQVLVAKFEEQLAEYGPFDFEQDTAAAEEAIAPYIDIWPRCPRCHQRRTAVCAICETAGDDFPVADAAPGGQSESAAVWLCPTCDEVVADRFLKLCEWCGWDFGHGLEIDKPMPITPVDTRVVLAMLAVAAILFALLAYFAFILS